MTHFETALRDAVEKGGYKVQNLRLNGSVLYHDAFTSVGGEKPAAMVLLDPAFFRALGKARGWENLGASGPYKGKKMHYGNKCFCDHPEQFFMHIYADHINANKDVESFFATLV